MEDRIIIDPHIRHGQPVIRGTRVPVSVLLKCFAGGMTSEEIQEDYGLQAGDIRAALDFAIELVEQEQHFAFPARL